ncbi:MAG: hypothetical protein HC828_11285 [Blastochloris sp.]|nr:hypothetical protein [Blastochloris sp.]
MSSTTVFHASGICGLNSGPAALVDLGRDEGQPFLQRLALGVGIGYGTYLFGLSFAFGAFVAGIVLSESDYSHQALSDVIPLRDVFGMLFFVSVGMLLDPVFLFNNLGLVLTAVVVVVIGKALIFVGITRAFGYGNSAPFVVGLGMFQVGEFSFVLARTGVSTNAISNDLYALVLAVAVVTMVLTPFASRLAVPLYNRWRVYRPRETLSTFNVTSDSLHDHVIVAGYGRAGRAATMVMERVGLSYVVVEIDQRTVDHAQANGVPIVFGDATSAVVLEAAGVHTARLLLVSVPDALDVQLIASRVRELNPKLLIVARAAGDGTAQRLKAAWCPRGGTTRTRSRAGNGAAGAGPVPYQPDRYSALQRHGPRGALCTAV